MKRLLAIPLIALFVAFVCAPAQAAVDGRIDQITQRGQVLSVVFSATSPGSAAAIDPASVRVTVAGQPAEVTVNRATGKVPRTVMLALDTTGSTNLAAAQDVAAAYLAALPKDVFVGLVTFDDDARQLVAPTTSRPAVTQALAEVQAARVAAAQREAELALRAQREAAREARAQADRAKAGHKQPAQPKVAAKPIPTVTVPDTALYDGAALATQVAGTKGVRSVVLLSGNENRGGAVPLEQAVRGIEKSGIGLDAVALGSGGARATAGLEALAQAGRGQVLAVAGTAGAVAESRTLAAASTRQIVIDVTVPPGVAGESEVTVNAVVDEIAVTDSTRLRIKAPPPPIEPGGASTVAGPMPADLPTVASATPWFARWWVALLALGMLFAGLFTVIIVAITRDETSEGRVSRRLSAYDVKTQGQKIATERGSEVARTAVEWASKVTARRDLDEMLAMKLETAGLPLKPAEWFLLHIGSTVTGLFVIGILSGFGIIPLFVGALVGFVAPYAFLSIKAERRRKAFQAAVPDMLSLVAGSLSAGHSVLQAFDMVARETSGVMKEELGRAIVEARLGVPMDDALFDVAERMQSKDFRWVVLAIRVNRDIGGDLSEVLRNVAAMLRERERVVRQIRALSAEGRLSAYVLVGLPVVFALYMSLTRPDYIGLLASTPVGIAMSVGTVVMVALGAVWMSRLIKVEV